MKPCQLSYRYFAIALVLMLMLSGCGKETPVPTPTNTPVPPTATPEPTATPTPTATPVPLAEWVAEGDAALARSDFAAAEAAYQRAADADPVFAPAQIGLAWTYGWWIGRSKDALPAAQRAVELAPESAAAWAVLGHAQYRNENATEAVKAAEKAVELDPKSGLAQAVLARAKAADLRHDAALKAAIEAVKLDPQSAYAYTSLAVAHEAMADFGRAQAAVEKAIALQPQFAQWHTHLGDLLAARLRYDAARAEYDKALANAPDYPRALLGKASLHMAKHEYEQAEKLIEQAAKAAPTDVEPLNRWGYLYLWQDEYEKAMAKFKEAAKLDPNDWSGKAGQARVHQYEGDCESAATIYQELSASYPRDASLRVDSGWAKYCLGDESRATELARAALTLDPYNSDAHYLLAVLLAGQERWEDATAAYLLAERYSAVAATAHTGLGDILMNQDDLEAAEAEFGLAARLDPDTAGGSAGLCTIGWWETEPEKMLAPCEKSAKLQPENEGAQGMWGIALFLNGRTEEAITVLKANLVEDPEHELSHLYLGLSYLRQKQYPLAKKGLETYLKIRQTSDSRFTALIDAAGEGWDLREAKALEELKKAGDQSADRPVTWKIESTGELTRTLTAALKALKDEDPQTTYNEATSLLTLAARYAIRITPEVNGGAIVRASDVAGKPLFAITVSVSDMWLYMGGDLSSYQYRDRIDFIQPAGGPRSAEMTDKLVKTTGAEVAKLRELATKQPVTSKRLDQAGLEEHLAASQEEEEQEEAHNDDLLLTMLGALSPDADLWALENDVEAEQILGFYDDEDKIFYVVTDKAPGLTDRMTAAHEYVHALQDQHFDIGTAREAIENDDRGIAYLSLIEGDAQLVTIQYVQEKLPVLELMQTFEAADTETDQEELDSSPGVLRGWLEFPYDQGYTFVEEVHSTGGWEAVNDLYKDPPISTEQLLHPDRYRAKEAPVEVALPDLSQVLGGDWRIAHDNTLGELTWRLILTELAGPAAAERAADGWGGDRYILLQQGQDGPGAALLRAEWDTADDAEEFWALVRTVLANRPGCDEVVVDLVGDGMTRHFRDPDAYWIVRLDGQAVTLAIGPAEDVATKLSAMVK